MGAATSSSNAERETELLRQQLSLKDAVIASKDAVISELRESKAASVGKAAQLGSRDKIGTRVEAASEARLQRLEAAISAISGSTSCEGHSGSKSGDSSSSSRNGDSSSCSSSSNSMNSSRNSADAPTQQQKRARSSPHFAQALEEDEVLDHIFGFVGRKDWLYVGGVCRRWRGRYLSMCYKACGSRAEYAFQTNYRSSFTTAARFLMALDNGLRMPDERTAGKFFDDLPKLSEDPIAVLTIARVYGAAWDESMCTDAAFYGNHELLKWLLRVGCPWSVHDVAVHAIRSKRGQHELILPWLLSVVRQWSQVLKNKLLIEAGIAHDITALKLMLAKGAHWPSSYLGKRCLTGVCVFAGTSEQLPGALIKAIVGVSGAVKISHQSCILFRFTEAMLRDSLHGLIRMAALALVRQLHTSSSAVVAVVAAVVMVATLTSFSGC
jgi:hypothetical protein